MTFLAIALFWLAAGLLGFLSREEYAFSRNYPFRAAGTTIFFALLVWASYHTMRGSATVADVLFRVPLFALVAILGTALAFRFWSSAIGDLFEGARSSLMGVDRMKVEKTYDLARKAEQEGDLEGAARLYAAEIERDRTDPEPFRLLAAIRIRQERTEEAMTLLREALPLIPNPEDRSTAAFRLSDLLVQAGRLPEARDMLLKVERTYPGTRFAHYARERRELLDSPPRNPITPG